MLVLKGGKKKITSYSSSLLLNGFFKKFFLGVLHFPHE